MGGRRNEAEEFGVDHLLTLKLDFCVPKISESIPRLRALPESRYNLSTYWGRVKEWAYLTDSRQAVDLRLAGS